MQVISLTKYSMLRKLWAWSVILVFLCALPFVVWAEKPPRDLLSQVTTTKPVHDGLCNFQAMKHVECLIYNDLARDVVWLILFDEKDDEMTITHVIGVKNNQEYVLWCRQDVCI